MFEALKPEERDERGKPRTATRVWLEGDTTLVLSVRASDIPALRAALNMWLRLINVAYEMQELVSHG
jgi:KEOPS complex subunit Pcc1